MVVLKKVGVMQLAKVNAIIMSIIGFIIGLIAVVISLTSGIFIPDQSSFLLIGTILVSIILPVIIYGILGFLIGMIIGFLYNTIANKIGGIELEFSK